MLSSAVVAALVAGAVSLAAVWVSGRRERLDRQRQLFAHAFEATVDYREFAYVVRRRNGDDPGGERVRISGELSVVQRHLASFEALLRVEAPRVGRTYVELVAETRRVAGPLISRGWDEPPAATDEDVHVAGVDYSDLHPFEDQYLRAVRDHLGFVPRLRRLLRRAGTRLRGGDRDVAAGG